MPKEKLTNHPCFITLKERHPNVRCFIFDMDGTLLNSEIIHSHSIASILVDHGHNQVCLNWVTETFAGVSDPHVYEKLIEIDKLCPKKITKEQFLDHKNNAFSKILPTIDKSSLFHENIESFLLMARAEDYKTALVTASERVVTEELMSHIELHSLFDTIKTREDFKETKPHPMPYTSTIKELELKLDEVIIFEDSKTGLESALKSGAIVYQAKWY